MTLSLQEVEARLADVQSRFNEAQTKKTASKEELDTYDAELYRLQGEFRVLNQMKELMSQAGGEVETTVADPALVLEAKPKKDKE